MYDLPAEIDVQADGALRIITLNRPDELNAVNDPLHVGLAKIWEALNEDAGARAAVITGAGRAFSAGGDFNYLDELRGNEALRQKTIKHGRDLVIGMVRCRIPVIAAVNGPAVGLGCSLAALSDIVYMAETAFFADPHVQIGLVAADGGPLVWGSQISLLQAKEFALTGVRIKAQRALELGLANHVVADPLADAIACAKKTLGAAPTGRRGHQAPDEHPTGEVGDGVAGLRQPRGVRLLRYRRLQQDRRRADREEQVELLRKPPSPTRCGARFFSRRFKPVTSRRVAANVESSMFAITFEGTGR